MADYPTLAPTLAALNGVKTTPSDLEAANMLAAVDRQTRMWIYDFLSTIVDPETGRLKASIVGVDSLSAGSVRGSTDNGGDQREVLQGSISSSDLRDLAVTTAKLEDGAVTTDKVADLAISSDKLGAAAVTAAKIGDGEVETAKLDDLAVTTAKINAKAVTTAKIADGAITATQIAEHGIDGANLPVGSVGQILLHNGTKYVSTSLSGAITVNGSGVATVSLTTTASWSRISERVASGTSGGASAAASWTQKRGVLTAWVIDEQTVANTVALGASGKINITTTGVFLVDVSVPGYSVGSHKVKVTYTPTTGPAVDYISSAECAGPGVQTACRLRFLLTVSAASSGSPATLDVFHWTELAKGTNGLGLATSAPTEVERYAMVELLRVSAS